MKILRTFEDKDIVLNQETDFQTNAGWEENLAQFEDEILSSIVNPIENYETVRYIHSPYISVSGVNQTDIWFYFYFYDVTGLTYTQDYSVTGLEPKENALLFNKSSESFFRLEFYKSPLKTWNSSNTYKLNEKVYYVINNTSGSTGNTYTSLISGNTNNNPDTSTGFWTILSGDTNSIYCEPPTRQNRKFVFAKNLSIPLGEKLFYTTLNQYISMPVFTGSNYRNKENMYLFWFKDESVFDETNLSGTTTGNTFFMTAKYYNTIDGSIIDFTNNTGYTEVNESKDMYYQIDIDKTNYSYQIFRYNDAVKGSRIGESGDPINFYEKRIV